MKRIILSVIFALTTLSVCAQGTYTRTGNNFTQVTAQKQSEATKTRLTYTTAKGEVFPIYLSKKGRAYIVRTSKKTGKEYKQYLGEDISREVCREYKVTYIK